VHKHSRGLLALTAVLVACPAVLGGDEPDAAKQAKDVLKQAREAVSKVKTASYMADYSVTGFATQFVPAVKGKVVIGPASKHEVERFLAKVEIRRDGSEEALELLAGCNGDEYFLIDEKSKTVYVDLDPAVLGSQGRNVRRVVLSEFHEKEPFKDALEADEIALDGSETVASEECHRIKIKGDRGSETTWWISKEDHLPRRVMRLFRRGEDVGTTDLLISSLELNPQFEDDPFRVRVPDGFRKTDEFAP
jgi:hypothetical protein